MPSGAGTQEETIMKRYLTTPTALLLSLGLLGACSAVDPKVQMDAADAVAMAEAIGDAQGAACYSAIEPLFATPAAGLLSKYELFRGGSIITTGPCASVFAGLALHILNKLPGVP
jgi:hypothetical protein